MKIRAFLAAFLASITSLHGQGEDASKRPTSLTIGGCQLVGGWSAGRSDIPRKILTHAEVGKLKYAVLYESTGRLGSMRKPDYANLLKDFAYLSEHYFEHPAYLKVDGKPVVFIYLTRVAQPVRLTFTQPDGLESHHITACREAWRCQNGVQLRITFLMG